MADAVAFGGKTLVKYCEIEKNEFISNTFLESAKISAVMSGSFTKKDVRQTGYFLETTNCGRQQSAPIWHVMLIYQGAKIVQAYLLGGYSNFVDEAFAVRDINANGYSEVGIVNLTGDYWQPHHLLNFIDWDANKNKPMLLGQVFTEESITQGEEFPRVTRKYTVYVAKGPQPTFVGLEGGSTTKLTLLTFQKPSLQIIPLR